MRQNRSVDLSTNFSFNINLQGTFGLAVFPTYNLNLNLQRAFLWRHFKNKNADKNLARFLRLVHRRRYVSGKRFENVQIDQDVRRDQHRLRLQQRHVRQVRRKWIISFDPWLCVHFALYDTIRWLVPLSCLFLLTASHYWWRLITFSR